MPMPWLATVSLAALLPAAWSQSNAIYAVDVREAVCAGRPGFVNITMTEGKEKKAPHVLTFYRTAPTQMSFSLELKDATGKEVVKQEIELVDATELEVRRLDDGWTPEEDQRMGTGCEEFFLSDGRSPVELPDTWAEARSAFQDVCLSEGLSLTQCKEAEEDVFQGEPKHEELLTASDNFCDGLTRKISEMNVIEVSGGKQVKMSSLRNLDGKPYKLGRRLKGGGSTGSGGTAASGGFGGAGLGTRTIGYSTVGRSSAFSATPRTTGYGYAGPSSYRRSMVVPIAAGTAGGFMFWRMRAGGSGHHRRSAANCGSTAAQDCYTRCSQCSTCVDDPGRDDCKDAQQVACDSYCKTSCDGYKTCYSANCVEGGNCTYMLENNITRDDLMTYGFIPAEFKHPLQLIIKSIGGAAFTASVKGEMCPPANYAGLTTDVTPTDAPWLFASAPDLFVQLNPMEEFYWADEAVVAEEEDAAGAAIGITVTMAILIIVCCCLTCCKKKNDEHVETMESRQQSAQKGNAQVMGRKTPNQIQVQIPQGATPGTRLQFTTPSGQAVQAVVPPNGKPGGTFTIQF